MDVTRLIAGLALGLAALTGSAQAPDDDTGSPPVPLGVRALHFYPPVVDQARQLTLAMALATRNGDADTDVPAWLRDVAAERRRLSELARLTAPVTVLPPDGEFACLARVIEVPEVPLTAGTDWSAALGWLSRPRQPALDAAIADLWLAGAHARLDGVWRAATQAVGAEAVTGLWQPLLDAASLHVATAGSGARVAVGPRDLRGRALALARRAEVTAAAEAPARTRMELAMERSETAFGRQRVLDGLWHAFDALEAGLGQPGLILEANLAERLNELGFAHRDDLLAVDPVLGGVLAQMADAASSLATGKPDPAVAVALGDAYAQLALFITDIGFYLEQPVRQGIREDIAECREAVTDDAPVARDRYEACLQTFFELTGDQARVSELTGEAGGPFAPEYLRRETALAAAQRMDFMLGYVDWELGGGCTAPGWFNVLEWSLGAALVDWWADRRTPYFTAPRWREALVTARRDAETYARDLTLHLDCLAGQGAERRDPVLRLLDELFAELRTLSGEIEAARAAFRAEHLAPGSDIRLDGSPELATRYRPEDLAVQACDPENTCGVTARLPVSRALLGLFPEQYLAADQTRMGRLELCYDRVEWVDRRASVARERDHSVADYEARLAFELVGRFRPDSGPAGEVFRMRLVSDARFHYLFGAAGDDMLARACPRDVVGTPVESRLPDDGFHLVPNRLTYYTTAPTTAEKVVLANWDQGAEWRDRFVTGRGIEVLGADDGEGFAPAVTTRIRELGTAMQQQIAGRMLRPPLMNESDALTLSMTRLTGLKDLLRRLLELAYPTLLRHGDDFRAAFTGAGALPDREMVRRMRSEQVPLADFPDRARERVRAFREHWTRLPDVYRESGQVPPELARAVLRLFALADVPAATSAERAEDPR